MWRRGEPTLPLVEQLHTMWRRGMHNKWRRGKRTLALVEQLRGTARCHRLAQPKRRLMHERRGPVHSPAAWCG